MKLSLKKQAAVPFILLSIALVALSCSSPQKYRIGISQCSDDDWRHKMNEEIQREAMLNDNVEIEIRSADDSSEKQIADLDYFMANNFDIIVVAPNEADALTPKIKEIYESGKPVVMFDRTIHGDYYTAFQGADNESIGEMAAAYAGTFRQDPKILEIKGLKGSTPAELRSKGFRRKAGTLGYEIVGEGYGNWNYEKACETVDSLLAAHPETTLIYCHNDRMAIGASEVAARRGRDDIKVIGIDAAPALGIQAVKDGKIDVTFLYPTDGYQLVRTALAILGNEQYEKNLILPSPAPVDASNAEILLLQDKALREETGKISVLQNRMNAFSERYSRQTYALYTTIVMLLLFAILIFMLMRSYWMGNKHRREIEQRNKELGRQRDELDALYRQLQEATGSKLTFFTNVSHDLRTPLTLIADPVNQLAEADNLTPQQHTLMQLASKNIKRLQRLINQILDIRKYDNGQLKLNLENLNLSEAMREWVAPFAELAAKRHIKFSASIPQKPALVTAIDVEKTERILFNLLSNAFKFTPENGSISVSVESDGKDAIIKVSDTGTGIPPEEINHIFERFFKTDRINPNGSGIGLALSKVFIDLQGGSISVESAEGSGSTFTVRLPIKHVSENSREPVATALYSIPDVAEIAEIEEEDLEMPEDAQTVLVIDDNRDICTLVKSVLSDHYTVVSASSGAVGIRLATKYVPDLIICDVMMPGMDGYEVCKALKNETITSHIPVLLLTACSRDEQRREGYECGADAFMSKPFESPTLVARVKSLLDNRRRIYEREDAGSKPAPEAKKGEPAKQKAKITAEDEFLTRFTELVEAEIGNSELSVEELADRIGISRVQLYRKIKALTNYSVAEMVRNIRLRRGAKMLKTSDVTVSEVAYSVGFSSLSYFSKCYREYFNETPAETQARTSKAR